MYLSYYNLTIKPFPEKTDLLARLWLSEKTKKELTAFRQGIEANRGILLLTGDVGTGKTSFINILVSSLPENIVVGNVVNPDLDRQGFMQVLADIFHLERGADDWEEFLPLFKQFLITAAGAGKNVLLIIDEAQQLSNDLLQMIEQLAELEDNGFKLLSIILVGHNDFNTVLFQPENTDLRQKIAISYNIVPLTKKETAHYIRHHLRLAGGSEDIFSPEAMNAVFNYTGGSPRLINLICDLALLSGFTSKSPVISQEIVDSCTKKLMLPPGKPFKLKPIVTHKTEKIGNRPYSRQRKTVWKKLSYGFVVILVLILFGALRLVDKMEAPDYRGTTDTQPIYNETVATPEAETPPPAQTLHELVTLQPSEPTAEQTLIPQQVTEEPDAAVTAGDSTTPTDETIQTAALPASNIGAETLPQKTAPERLLIIQEKPFPVKKHTHTENFTDADYHNASKKVVTVLLGNLRDGPSITANVIGVARQGDIVIGLREKENWHFVKLADGSLGWMHQSLFVKPKIAIEKVEKPAAQPVPAGRVEILALAESGASPAETPRTPGPASIKPSGSLKGKSSPSEVPTALQKTIVKTGNPEALEWTQKSFESVTQGKFTLAIDQATKALVLDPGLVNPYINRAWAYSETGAYDKAIVDCNTALMLDPDNGLAFNNRGLVYHRQGEEIRAQQDYKKACDMGIQVGCDNYQEVTTRIEVNKFQLESEQNLALGKWDTVIQLNNEILQLDPTNESALSTRIRAEKMKLRDHEEAMQLNQLSYESVLRGKYSQSIDEASKAISLDPNLVDPYINRAWAYSETGVYDKAIADCNTALKLDPDNALALNNRGLAYHRQGAKKQALNDYKKACEMDLAVACSNYQQLSPLQENPDI